MIDLHTHSTASDGTCTPGELVSLARRKNLTVLALTDHDTVDGLEEASAAAKAADIRFIPGIEISLRADRGDFHLLGLGLTRWQDPEFQNGVKKLQDQRKTRNLAMMKKFAEAGFPLTPGEKQQILSSPAAGRPHFGKVLVSRGVVPSLDEAFGLWIGDGKPLWVPRTEIDLDEGLELIRQGGGIPVVAHPLSLRLSWPRVEARLREWKDRGVRGLEVYHSSFTMTKCRRLEKLADQFGFLKTAGSDYHGTVKPKIKLGRLNSRNPITEAMAEEFLREAAP